MEKTFNLEVKLNQVGLFKMYHISWRVSVLMSSPVKIRFSVTWTFNHIPSLSSEYLFVVQFAGAQLDGCPVILDIQEEEDVHQMYSFTNNVSVYFITFPCM